MLYLPGFDVIGKQDGETSIDYARRLINDLYYNKPYPWAVAYSGGKDSTLLLQLVCEVSEKHNWTKPVFVCFNDTGIELDNKNARIAYVFSKLKEVGIKTVISRPQYSFWYFVCGLGYPMPENNLRYCTSALKLQPASQFERAICLKYGGLISFKGVRKEESPNRMKIYTKKGAPERLELVNNKYQNFFFFPIADVLTSELWTYLESLGSFYWGEPLSELKKLYPSNSIRQRDGCWCCPLGSETTYETKETNEKQDNVRNFLRVINTDCQKKNLCSTRKQEERLAQGVAAGRFTLDARKEIFEYIYSVYPEAFSEQDRDVIPKCWDYFKKGGGILPRRISLNNQQILEKFKDF